MSNFFQIFNFIGSSVIYLSLSEIPIWTHQRHFGLKSKSAGAPSNLLINDDSTLFSVQQGETKDRLKVHYKTPYDCYIEICFNLNCLW